MADEQEDPPIGTAQNAADVARKVELEAHEADISGRLQAHNEAHALRMGIVRHAVNEDALPWSDEQIAEAYRHMDRNTFSGEGASEQEFREALVMLVKATHDNG